jgi:cellulose biosynthesis protein BcsQ
MDGMAGTGKTTIACTLSNALKSRGQPAASFFCTRTSPECHDATKIVSAIAYQFAQHSSPFKSALYKALKADPDIASLNISTRFEQLIKGPVLAVE